MVMSALGAGATKMPGVRTSDIPRTILVHSTPLLTERQPILHRGPTLQNSVNEQLLQLSSIRALLSSPWV